MNNYVLISMQSLLHAPKQLRPSQEIFIQRTYIHGPSLHNDHGDFFFHDNDVGKTKVKR